MSAVPTYRFKFALVDEATGEVISSDFCALTSIDQFGGCESVDMHVASMLRAFERTVREEYERQNYAPVDEEEGV